MAATLNSSSGTGGRGGGRPHLATAAVAPAPAMSVVVQAAVAWPTSYVGAANERAIRQKGPDQIFQVCKGKGRAEYMYMQYSVEHSVCICQSTIGLRGRQRCGGGGLHGRRIQRQVRSLM